MSKIIRIEEYDSRGPILNNFYQTESRTQKLFNWLVVGFGPKGMPGRMCDIVR